MTETTEQNQKQKGDIIAAQIGDGAKGVAVGKNIIQIGSLQIPYWLAFGILLLLLVGVGIGIVNVYRNQATADDTQAVRKILENTPTPTSTPLPTATPVRMSGPLFNIAVAEFGESTQAGQLQPSTVGTDLSRIVFNSLQGEYERNPPFGEKGQVQIWHLGDNQAERQITQVMVTGRTDAERSAAAKQLAESIRADLIVYGNLAIEDDPGSLNLEFYYNYPQLHELPDAVGGRYELGQPMPFDVSPVAEPNRAKFSVNEPLLFRSKILFWLTIGLAYDINGQNEKALTELQRAEQELTNWTMIDGREVDGKEILYYFIGRSALHLRRYDEATRAFNAALKIDDAYANALIGLGSVSYDRAQLSFARQQPLTDGVEKCVSEEEIAASSPTPEDALNEIEQAIRLFEKALDAAPNAPWPPVEHIARLDLGLVYRLRGQALNLQGKSSAAAAEYQQALDELEKAVQPFQQLEQAELLGHTYLALGVVYQSQANLFARLQQPDQSAIALGEALKQYAQCIDLADDSNANLFFKKQIVECGCRPFKLETEKALIALGGGEG